MADDPTTLVRLLQRSDAEIAAAFRAEALAELRAWLDGFAPPAVPTAPPAPPDVPQTHASETSEPDESHGECLMDRGNTPAPAVSPVRSTRLTGEMIRAWRLSFTPTLSQERLGAQLGVTGHTVSAWERETQPIPSVAEDELWLLMAKKDHA